MPHSGRASTGSAEEPRERPPRWLPLYLGQSFTLCLQEALLRDRANAAPPGPFLVAEAELALWDWAEKHGLVQQTG